jgi:hypothetical protein
MHIKDNLLNAQYLADYDKVIEINLKSVFNMIKAVQKNDAKTVKVLIINKERSCVKRKCRTSTMRQFLKSE